MGTSLKPWHEVVEVREDLRTGELSLAAFAADLHDVVMQKGHRPVYENPAEFFALTYPTYSLRMLVGDVCMRLAGRTDKAYRRLSVDYGGGKTHSLITLRHLVSEPDNLPDLPAVREFRAHIGHSIPRSRVVALCFDKIDLEKGVETLGPDGSVRMLKYPWSILAFQLDGERGLRFIRGSGEDTERDTPPAEPLLVELLSKPQTEGLSTLILLDEVLMYLRGKIESDSSSRGLMMNFFQYLTQAVVKVDRCAMVASLLASDPSKYDELGIDILRELSERFVRQTEEDIVPVRKEDVAEVLRRRFFKPESLSDAGSFRPHATQVVGNIAALDEQTSKERPSVEERFIASYPFHPDMTDVFYTRWTQLEGFQRTRGILRTFAIALRDAEKWDTNPLVGPNIFLAEPNTDGLSESASELAAFASVDAGTGSHQEWRPILEGELAKARGIQSEATGLQNREMEQAVISVFLCSQPIGQKALTNELIVLTGATKPDQIEFEKSLNRWTELSWFLDEVEVGGVELLPDGNRRLPQSWRLGNRPNLRQMHDDACRNRVQQVRVEERLLEEIRRQNFLTAGATAAGAKTHNLPQSPRDVQDDGKFHYAVLGPDAASESGKPSSLAKRFIDENTGPQTPRVNRNAIVLAVPTREGLDIALNRIRQHLGWLEVRELLKGQSNDPTRESMLIRETANANKLIPEAIRQAYSVVVTVKENNEVAAFKIAVSDESLFLTIKADDRARIQETAISAEAMLPGGPYDLWREDEESRRVSSLVGAFAQFAKLPKMLHQKEILYTIVQGVREGIWVAQLTRPDNSAKTFWRTSIDEQLLEAPALEVFLPEVAVLSDIAPELLAHKALPSLWTADEIKVSDVVDYFAGGKRVTVPREGYEETVFIPRCEAGCVEDAILLAVERGHLWLTNGPASIFGEAVPDGVLSSTAILRPPPTALGVSELTEISIPGAWKDGKANALAIVTALSSLKEVNLPWPTVRKAIDSALHTGWLELSDDSAPWTSSFTEPQNIVFQVPETQPAPIPGQTSKLGTVVAEAALEANGIQDLADQIPEIAKAAIGNSLKFNVRIELGGDELPDSGVIDEINSILLEVSDELKLQ